VPCSGFGVLGKKPELRYKDPETSSALPATQYDILSSSVRYLKRGGVLVYSTCTIFPEENENNVTKFLSENEEFELEPFSVGNYNCDKGMATFLPDREGTDGFFVARLKKKD
jgi:16S rRNA (cytosine967-C5)-methyltransferase